MPLRHNFTWQVMLAPPRSVNGKDRAGIACGSWLLILILILIRSRPSDARMGINRGQSYGYDPLDPLEDS